MNTSTNLFDLYRDPFGTWMLRTAQGQTHERVTVVRPFPISAPSESASILSQDGRELVWVDRLADLPGPLQETLIEALTQREFMPEILRRRPWRAVLDPPSALTGSDDAQAIGSLHVKTPP